MSKILGVHQSQQIRNYLANGSFIIAQRGTSFAGSAAVVTKSLDRWNFWLGGTMASTVSQQAAVNGIGYAIRVARNSGATQNTNIQMVQHIDLETAKSLAGKTMTLSFYGRKGADFSSSLAASVSFGTAASEVNLITAGFTSTTAQSSNISLSSTSTKYSFTFTVPSGTQQMAINFQTLAYSGTAGANDWYELEQVMLNEGNSAQPFALLGDSVEAELRNCMRYYEESMPSGGLGNANDGIASGTNVVTGFRFKVVKRINNPTVSLYSRSSTINKISAVASGADVGTTVTAGVISANGVNIAADSGTGFTIGAAYEVFFKADAEL